MAIVRDRSDEVIGALTVLHRAPTPIGRAANCSYWWVRCVCGEEYILSAECLQKGANGGSTNCGCIQVANSKQKKINVKHGFHRSHVDNKPNHPLYVVWALMKSRCGNPKNKSFDDYGGRGISVCAEWQKDAAAFITWGIANGYERGLELDRRNNDGNYEPSNCRFVTRLVNARNRRPRRWKVKPKEAVAV